jgi:hypothetical protein
MQEWQIKEVWRLKFGPNALLLFGNHGLLNEFKKFKKIRFNQAFFSLFNGTVCFIKCKLLT